MNRNGTGSKTVHTIEAMLADCEIDDSEREEALAHKDVLDFFNNGEIGPGHCDDGAPGGGTDEPAGSGGEPTVGDDHAGLETVCRNRHDRIHIRVEPDIGGVNEGVCAFGQTVLAVEVNELTLSRCLLGNKVRKNLDLFAKRNYHYTSLVTSHDPDKIYNLDAALSLPRLLMEMLVFSRPGHIELMPTWPKDFEEGAIRGMLVRGGHKIDLAWRDGTFKYAALYAGQDERITVSCGDEIRTLDCRAGEVYRLDHRLKVID